MNWLFEQRARNSSPAKKKDFEPHKMYKGKTSVTADTFQEHLDLGKKGYDHSPAKSKESRAERKEFRQERRAERKNKREIRKTTKGKGRNFRSTEEGAGMTSTGVKAYKAKNPGSKLKTAVTGDVKPGSKAAGRRKSFCARSKGWTGERGKAARARWKLSLIHI